MNNLKVLAALAVIIVSFLPLVQPCNQASIINTNQYRGSLHFTCLVKPPDIGRPRLEVVRFSDRRIILSKELDELTVSQMVSFVDANGWLRILLAVPDRVNGTSMYSLDNAGQLVDEHHTINTQYVNAMSTWKLELNWEWQLAIANQPTYEPYAKFGVSIPVQDKIVDPKPMISIHSWRSTYFDSYQIIHLPESDGRVTKLEPMNINGQEFLIIALEPERQHQLEPSINSLIYKLDFGDGSLEWVFFQSLDVRTAYDVKSFTIAHRDSLQRDYYIALLGQHVSGGYGLIIYKYFGDKFMKIHAMPAANATKLDAITYGHGDTYVVIALLSEMTHQIEIHSYDGLELKKLPAPDTRQRRSSFHLFHLPMLHQSDGISEAGATKRALGDNKSEIEMPALAIGAMDPQNIGSVPGNDSDNLYHIPVPESESSYSKRNLNDNYGANLLAWCKSLIDQINNDNFIQTSKQILGLPRIDQRRPIELHGDLIIEDDLHVSNLLFTKNIKENPQGLGLAGNQANFSTTFAQIHQTHMEIDRVKQQVDQILVDDGSDQEVFNPLSFDTVIVECLTPNSLDPRYMHMTPIGSSCPRIGELRTVRINSRDITGIQQQALIAGRAMTITSDVRFEHLILRGSTEILGPLNDIPINEIIFKRGPSNGTVLGHKHFVQGLYSASKLHVMRWENNEVDRFHYLTTTGDQRIEAHLRFHQVLLDSSVHSTSSRFEKLNGIHLDSHLYQIAQQDDNNLFDIPVRFEELILNGPITFHQGSSLSSIDLNDQLRNTMFKGFNQNISAPIEFAGDVHVTYGGDINVKGLINGLLLNRSSIMMRTGDYDIPNRIIFENDVLVRNNLQLALALNGVQITWNSATRQNELAIMYNRGNQLITGDKIFGSVQLGGRSQINGHINGHLNLTQLYLLTNGNNGQPFRFTHIHLSGRNIQLDEGTSAQMYISSAVNNIPVNNICGLANSLISLANQPAQYKRLKFEHPVHFRSLRCASINGFNDLSRAFLTRYGNQHVLGSLRLTNGLVLNTTVNIRQSFNELAVASMAAAIAKTVNETKTGHKEVYGDLWLDELFTERLNDLRLSNILVTKSDTPLFVQAPMKFDHLDIENVLSLSGNLLTKTFNGLNIDDLLGNTLQYDTEQVIHNHVTLNNLQLLPGTNLLTKSLNGYDLQRLYADSVFFDVPQQILASKTFRGSVDFTDKLFMRYGIDELSEQELKFNLLLQSDEMIAGDLEFYNDIHVKQELEIKSGIINDIDIKQFVDTMLYENRPDQRGMRIFGNGSVRFKDVRVNNLVVAGTIQGIDLSREAILRPDSPNMTAPILVPDQQHRPTTANPPYTLGTIVPAPRPTPQPNHTKVPMQRILPPQYQVHTPQYQVQTPQYQVQTPQYRVQSPQQYQVPQPKLRVQLPLSQYPLALARDMDLVNHTLMKTTWKPNWNQIMVAPHVEPAQNLVNLTRYQEYQSLMYAQAIKDLARRINKYLSMSFYYEIFQRLDAPLLHAASNPVNDQGSALLILKGINKEGEPFLKRGQSVSVNGWLTQKPDRHSNSPPIPRFSQMSLIEDTSDPALVESLVIGDKDHYLFISDWSSGQFKNTVSQILIYSWDYRSGRYEALERLDIDGFPTRIKAFTYNGLGCLALATPFVKYGGFVIGGPIIYCQTGPRSRFGRKKVVPLSNVRDLDIIVPASRGSSILLATISQQSTEQVGDLTISSYDLASGALMNVTVRRMVRPLRLHFFRDSAIRLVVSEGITSNDAAQSLARIFTLRQNRLDQTQIIRDNQFHDIQSIRWRGNSTLLFLQSAHSIAIFAPDCDEQFSILHRLPTKGANEFAVFNERGSLGHFLVLSNSESILILKTRK